MLTSPIKSIALVSFLVFCSPAVFSTTTSSLSSEYAQAPWPSGHRDQSNTDYVPFPLAADVKIAKHLLKSNAILWPAITGPEGNMYISTGKGDGFSHLHAFDASGTPLWNAKPQRSLQDLDALAVINAPTVDKRGQLYQADSNQLWSFSASGEVLWTTDLEQYGAKGGFVGTILLPNGLVGGISRNGKVLVFTRQNGELARPAFDLPGGNGPKGKTAPSGLWRDLMDASIIQDLFNLIQGWEMEVANTPAVHPETGRIFITAQGEQTNSGALYGLDVGETEIELAFSLPMPNASGTSPSISHDGKRVYAVGGNGTMVAANTHTGEQVWQSTEMVGASASPSIGDDETIYSPHQASLIALNSDGSTKYVYSYNEYCEQRLGKTGFWWGLFFSNPVAFIDSIVTVSSDGTGRINIVCGNHIRLLSWFQDKRTAIPLPLDSTLVRISLNTGEILGKPVELPDTSEGFITPAANGNQFVSLSGAMRSSFYYGLNKFLPSRFSVKAPLGGMLILEPANREALALAGIDAGKAAVTEALSLLRAKNYTAAGQRLQGIASHVNVSYAALASARPDRTFNAGVISSAADQISKAETEIERKRYAAARSALFSAKLMFQQLSIALSAADDGAEAKDLEKEPNKAEG